MAKFLNQLLTKTTKRSCRDEGIESKTIVTRCVAMKSEEQRPRLTTCSGERELRRRCRLVLIFEV